MVRIAPYDSTNKEENQENVLEKSCHITFLEEEFTHSSMMASTIL
jgi:hypothetical protein